MRLALYQPDIPQNTGAMVRLAACFGLGLDIIEPCGFPLDERSLKRVAMDYKDIAFIKRHASWDDFQSQTGSARLVLLTTKADTAYTDFVFAPDDILLVGRESSGVPLDVAAACHSRIIIPMTPPARSLNVGMAAAIVIGEAIRQCQKTVRIHP